MDFAEKRRHPRKDVFSASLIAYGDEGYLTEVWDLSQGGARVGKPARWNKERGTEVRIYFMLDQDTVITVAARVVRVTDDHLGLEFAVGQDARVDALLYEARFLEQSSTP